MLLSPTSASVAFGKTLYLDSREIGKDGFLTEAQKTDEVRRKTDIDVPIYRHCVRKGNGDMRAEYQMEGERADIIENPIRQEHITNLFKNLFILDKAEILHDDLSLEHLYFSDKGGVGIDGFRHSINFNYKNGVFTSNLGKNDTMPSNAQEFEEDGLCDYIQSMKTEREQLGFLEKYLKEKSIYHANRASYLYNTKGLNLSNKAVQAEFIKAEAYSNPSRKVLRNELDKLNLYTMGKQALDMWKDGYGATDGIKKPNQRVNSVLMLFDCLKYSIQLRDDAESISTPPYLYNSDIQYFEIEKEFFDDFSAKLLDTIKEAGTRTFTKKTFKKQFKIVGAQPNLNISEEAKKFGNLCSKIKPGASYEDTKNAINEAERYYGSLAYKDHNDNIIYA